jgi:hypothetical protein
MEYVSITYLRLISCSRFAVLLETEMAYLLATDVVLSRLHKEVKRIVYFPPLSFMLGWLSKL